jgi:hypothetical protein
LSLCGAVHYPPATRQTYPTSSGWGFLFRDSALTIAESPPKSTTIRSCFLSCRAMAIYRLIANGSFGPAEIEAMTAAYEAALLDLGLDRDAPITEIIATAIVTITSKGERDPATIKDRALNAIGARNLDSNAA